MTSPEDQSILYHNEPNTVFIIDIPSSIAQAQGLTPDPRDGTAGTSAGDLEPGRNVSRKHILSAPPLESPYAGSCEPKTEAARARLLEQVPTNEKLFHDEIQPLLLSALHGIRGKYRGARWCRPRHFSDEEIPRTRKRRAEPEYATLEKRTQNLLKGSSTAKVSRSHHAAPNIRPPTILSSTSTNVFESISSLDGIVRNPSSQPALLKADCHDGIEPAPSEYIIPPESQFILCTIPISEPRPKSTFPITGLPSTQKFNLVLFDPPWPNRSVRRSGHYSTHPYELLTQRLQDILHMHAFTSDQTPPLNNLYRYPQSQLSLAGIWTTNSEKSRQTAYDSLTSTGFTVVEEWIWIKITANGDPVSPVNGLWRKPYEILVIGRREPVSVTVPEPEIPFSSCKSLEPDPCVPKRRFIAAVPDLHSRKPNLKGLFERLFFARDGSVQQYTALEVFARNLTAGWCAAGNEVIKFNARECWVEG
ncbi:uncharacterized protein N7443_006871 [Penicillium atrosanguineum]|uniref:uncharacterized protein n=1 Tax=Penicillium atrosanguineum TaxID=1132637 RepID=UPI002396AE9B|nr:uncharacterized protein N7443_006871 [Penicillium atrosanguineum]KAJ5298751.1 hypothetical protein N7443_006871 [Penicillium atrosanguineum]